MLAAILTARSGSAPSASRSPDNPHETCPCVTGTACHRQPARAPRSPSHRPQNDAPPRRHGREESISRLRVQSQPPSASSTVPPGRSTPRPATKLEKDKAELPEKKEVGNVLRLRLWSTGSLPFYPSERNVSPPCVCSEGAFPAPPSPEGVAERNVCWH